MTEPEPPSRDQELTAVDAHVAGEPLRVITGGFPEPPGATVLEQRRYATRHLDHLRSALMLEPRGHADMYGCLLTPPTTEDGDFGVLFMHNDGFSTMCGHGIIGVVTVAIECGLVPALGPAPTLRIDTPAGRVVANATVKRRQVEQVAFTNVPSFLLASDLATAVPGLGIVRCDLAFGGAFYAYVDAATIGLDLRPANAARIIEVGRRIKQAVSKAHVIRHPAGHPDLNFLYGTIFVGSARDPIHSRNVCVFADGELDRSPTGTGVSGHAAILHARGGLAVGEWVTIESVIGTRFEVRVLETTTVNGWDSVIPEVAGRAWITGHHQFVVHPDDPLRHGFLVR
jgi:trans-L-3-hydroxyproline dehydratase